MTASHATTGPCDPRWLGWLMTGARRHHHGRGHRSGGPWFGGGPLGFGPRGPFGGGGPRARRGDVRAALLTLLAEEPRNGYQLMQEIERRSGGVWRPSPGSVYPALQQLEDEGLVRVEGSGGGKRFELTDAGRDAVPEGGAPWDTVSDSVDTDVWELFGEARQVGVAVFQIAQAGSAEQLAAARSVLANARRSLYGLLADAGEPPEEV